MKNEKLHEQNDFENVRALIEWAGEEYKGKNLFSYRKSLKSEATRVKFEEGKCATLVYSPSMPFSLCAEFPKGVKKDECGEFSDLYRTIDSDFFAGLMKDILNFFETGEVSFDPAETVNAMKIRGALIAAMENPGEIIKC